MPPLPSEVERAMKTIKFPLPEKYGGIDDWEVFCQWIQGLSRYFVMCGLTGNSPALDMARVNAISMFLKDQALTWYNHRVNHPARATFEQWTAVTLFGALFDRFIQNVTDDDARDKYEDIRFESSKGVVPFYSAMMDAVELLARRPSEGELVRKFFDGLPASMRSKMIEYHNISRERSSMKKVFKAAKRVEEAHRQVQAAMASSSGKHRTITMQPSEMCTSTVAPDQTQADSTTLANYIAGSSYKNHTGFDSTSQSELYGLQKNHQQAHPSQHTSGTESSNWQPENPGLHQDAPQVGESKPHNATTGIVNPELSSRAVTSGSNLIPAAGKLPIQCFHCGQPGHIRPKCPKLTNVMRMNAARVETVDPELTGSYSKAIEEPLVYETLEEAEEALRRAAGDA
ncbi:hypothetical protein K474DRAFT_1707000 [Panus rudis PR-1116 ss-1]|nr:hypothetical protein K474DRAFT_1707000 [Panus rudis PR-1116 ss-1]